MKNKLLVGFFVIICLNCSLIAQELYNQVIPVGWIDCREVHVSEGRFSIHTNLGVVELKVLDYDEEGERYLVECINCGDYYYPFPESS